MLHRADLSQAVVFSVVNFSYNYLQWHLITRGLKCLSYEERLRELGSCSSGKRRLQKDHTAAIQYLKGAYKQEERWLFTQSDSDRTGGDDNCFNLKEGRFKLGISRKLFTLGMVRHRHCCPEKLWMLHPWRCSRPGWMVLWATWSGGWQPCPQQEGWNFMGFTAPSNPSHSMTLWNFWFTITISSF